MAEEKTFREQLLVVFEVLTGTQGEHGLGSWLRRQMEGRKGWHPAPSTVHRWIQGTMTPDPSALAVLQELEEEARVLLHEKLEQIGG